MFYNIFSLVNNSMFRYICPVVKFILGFYQISLSHSKVQLREEDIYLTQSNNITKYLKLPLPRNHFGGAAKIQVLRPTLFCVTPSCLTFNKHLVLILMIDLYSLYHLVVGLPHLYKSEVLLYSHIHTVMN